MKFRTTIEIVSEATDKHEALELVGEYLAGNIISGVDMRCTTRSAVGVKKIIVSCIAVSLFLFIGIASMGHLKAGTGLFSNLASVSAVQPPLKTSINKDADFKKKWDERQATQALSRITK